MEDSVKYKQLDVRREFREVGLVNFAADGLYVAVQEEPASKQQRAETKSKRAEVLQSAEQGPIFMGSSRRFMSQYMLQSN